MNVKKAEEVEAKINSRWLKGQVKNRECLLNVCMINIFKCIKFLSILHLGQTVKIKAQFRKS